MNINAESNLRANDLLMIELYGFVVSCQVFYKIDTPTELFLRETRGNDWNHVKNGFFFSSSFIGVVHTVLHLHSILTVISTSTPHFALIVILVK